LRLAWPATNATMPLGGSCQNLQDLLNPGSETLPAPVSEGGESVRVGERLLLVANSLPLRMFRASEYTPGAGAGEGGGGAGGGGSSSAAGAGAAPAPAAAAHGWVFEWDQDALAAQTREGLSSPDLTVLHIGTLPAEVDPLVQEAVAADVLASFGCVVVFLGEELKERFYKRFCKKLLWPLMHYLQPLLPSSQMRFDRTLWQAYLTANKKFADKIMEVISPDDDHVWAHDYHLMLLPSFLRKRCHSIRCGFFLHSPFPSSEVFRSFPERNALLRALLNADMIGFHTFDYARHFLSCCTRMLGLDYQSVRGTLGIDYYGRLVSIKICPTGVQPSRLLSGFEWPECKWRRGELLAQFKGRKVLLGVDDMDIFKGIDLKLQAYQTLLTTHPEWIGQVVLVQVTNAPRSPGADVQELREEVLRLTEEINRDYGSEGYEPVLLLERHVPLHERIALYSVADCLVVTATRDGMNLTPYEYITCREGPDLFDDEAVQYKSGASSLVLSEFVGCSPSLSGAIRVNPWNTIDVSDGIFRCISMTPAELGLRHEKHWKYVKEHTVAYWGQSNFGELQRVCASSTNRTRCYGLGFGLNFRVVALDHSFRKLVDQQVVQAYVAAPRRALLLDYDGTMAVQTSLPNLPSVEVLSVLQSLAADPANEVYIISGRGKRILTQWFADTPQVGLAAEHGFFSRSPGDVEWKEALPGAMADIEWKEAVLPVMELYTESTDGSYIEAKESAVVWHYQDADPDFGSWQAKELLDHLESVLTNEPVEVVSGSGIVEVKPQGVGKGMVVEAVLMGDKSAFPEFVLCIGDDRSDEDMFQRLDTLVDEHPRFNPAVFACTVGQKPSKAKYFLDDVQDVLALMHSLAKESDTKRGVPVSAPEGE